ncbi:MAG: hypothetical protein NTV21_20360 [Planctomycetota bacterium]|nr:hypothetical protein [Planctomycetota bacterium]
MQVTRLRHERRLVAADGRQREVLDAVARAVVAHAVDVAREDRAHVAGGGELGVHLLPVVAVLAAEPARMVQEHEHVLGTFRARERLVEERVLLGAHALALGLVEVALARLRVGLVGVERDEPRALVAEGVPKRAEVGLVVGLVLLGRALALAAPVQVVVADDGKPRAAQAFHDPGELVGLLLPRRAVVVALHEIADGHHEIGPDHVDLVDGLREHLDAVRGPSGAVAEDHEAESVALLGQRQRHLARARRHETLRALVSRLLVVEREREQHRQGEQNEPQGTREHAAQSSAALSGPAAGP